MDRSNENAFPSNCARRSGGTKRVMALISRDTRKLPSSNKAMN